MGKRLKAKADLADRKNISLSPAMIRMGKKLASERSMSFSGFLADLIRRARDLDRTPTMQMYGVADQANRFDAVNHAIDQLRTRIKQGEDYSNSLFDHLRRTDAAIGKLDHRVRALEEAAKPPNSLSQDRGVRQV